MHTPGRNLTPIMLAFAAASMGPDAVVNALVPRRGKTIVPPTQSSDERMAMAEAKRARKNARRARAAAELAK